MTVADKLTQVQQDITNARSAIVAKGGSVTSGGGSSQLATDIATIPTGGTPTPTQTKAITITQNGTQEVNPDSGYALSKVTVTANVASPSSVEYGILYFIDYDGTILHQYTRTEALALTALPANPTRTGMTAQGWNFTLSEIQTYMTNNPEGDMWVGQLYITDDGKTRFYITVAEGTRTLRIRGIYVKGTMYLDWGDGSTVETFTYEDYTSITSTHTYASSGSYVVKLYRADSTSTFKMWANGYSYTVFTSVDEGSYANTSKYSSWYRMLKKIEYGEGLSYARGETEYSDVEYLNYPSEFTSQAIVESNSYKMKVLICKEYWLSGETHIPNLKTLSGKNTSIYNQNTLPQLENMTLWDAGYFDMDYFSAPALKKIVIPHSSYFEYQIIKDKRTILSSGITTDSMGLLWANNNSVFAGLDIEATRGKTMDLTGHTFRLPSKFGSSSALWEKMIFPSTITINSNQYIYLGAVKEIEWHINTSSNVRLTDKDNYNSNVLKKVVWDGVIGGNVEIHGPRLEEIDFSGATTTGQYCLYLYYLNTDTIEIPAVFTSMDLSGNLRKLKINEGTDITRNIGIYGLQVMDFRTRTTVPTLGSASIITQLIGSYYATDLKIVVPDALYDTWITSTNWSDSTIVAHTVKASDYSD